MGIFRRYNDAAERLGAGTADFLDEATVGIRNFSCGLWNQYPRFISVTSLGAAPFVRGLMNNLCAPGTPPPPESPFTGGQCSGDRYVISVEYDYLPAGSTTPATRVGGLVGAPGILGAITDISFPANTSGDDLVSTITYQDGVAQIVRVDTPGAGAQIFPDTVRYIITRADGQPDTCGDPAPEYPDVVVNVNDFSDTITINAFDGENIDIDIQYEPGDVHFPMTFNFGGVDVEINLVGVYFNFGGVSPTGNPGGDSNGNPSPVPVPRDTQRRIDYEVSQPEPNVNDYEVVPRPPATGEEEDIGISLEFVRVEIISTPSNPKSQNGDGAPDVFYCGWFEFQADGYNFRREPLHFLRNVFKAPAGATGYAYTVYEGFVGQATTYSLKGG